MYAQAKPIYYGLAAIVVSTAFFLFVPLSNPEVASVQQDMVQRLDIGWQQTIGDRAWFEEVFFIYDTVQNFYTQSADATIAFLEDSEADADIYFVWGSVYQIFADVFDQSDSNLAHGPLPSAETVPNFMTEEPLYNLIPYREVVKTIETPVVAGSATGAWRTIIDGVTGQSYCLAIFNGEVNQYVGTCSSQGYY
ncbi:MAG: hypothetical protein A3I07_02000 [Candidatus Doudnabacteria bacterium RIFCSPLOWO2_02_FULL_42_9]|uniref:Uncharacterized protein n=1 Tax=Candidatus Doudnabacteria bacterium RIFCSPHIGHO2_01_FULL_41_86 TaxID=1817821 RepID=A0A1F5N7S6_9BACT|nr:MAG: hypothetical protein A2717_03645 [Candidatus Doudnabacteria bacterium RIFCSPHIGHO2_01_FULL_41_86]OGE74768.1 MAG: hypothetical protein A3K07_03240 [Candidatus Doudnabacteria bacterium RIFCSPHIGHO2_01_43_10]OGE85735.1 MAG: hypothetical protein A3E28_02975 [Candidatus Doudnabacteria bacterium RIFCSPHIGHO2_12_FULL_42_22]OGE87231.1 MAG: hypothetical protein A3C49_00605 [Candidatus Doudnabacteria bacterium RIFCSPHIGHO2_02_FULL_42_25]OGE92068.1 MAG: hypothetical protein A2895_00480 [Candidatus